MILADVKPMHCQNVLNQMKDKYKSSTIYQTRITMNLYVHVTDDEKEKEVQNVEKMLKII